MRRHGRCLPAVLCLAAVVAGCTRAKKPRERGELTEAEKSVVAAFTSGTISRESPIRVAFHEGVARPEPVGAPLDEAFDRPVLVVLGFRGPLAHSTSASVLLRFPSGL